MKQLTLFCDDDLRDDFMDVDPEALLRDGWDMAVSISGGKDSQAMLKHLKRWHERQGFTGRLVAVHADLGRAEWGITPRVVEQQCTDLNVPLYVVRRNDGLDLPALMDRRRAKLDGTDTPFWPSSAARYCTSDEKRAVIDVWLRNEWPSGRLIMAMGMRAEESRNRAKLPIVSLRKNNCNTRTRKVINWLPIHDWLLPDVWRNIGYSMGQLRDIQQQVAARLKAGEDKNAVIEDLVTAFHAHPAYALGNSRLSCALCVLADEHDLQNGAEYSPALYHMYTRWEMETGFAFQDGKWLCALRPDLLEPDVRAWWEQRT